MSNKVSGKINYSEVESPKTDMSKVKDIAKTDQHNPSGKGQPSNADYYPKK